MSALDAFLSQAASDCVNARGVAGVWLSARLLDLARNVASEPCRTPRPLPPCQPGRSLCTPCEARMLVAEAVRQ